MSIQIFGDISKTLPPFEMKISHVSFIVYIYIGYVAYKRKPKPKP